MEWIGYLLALLVGLTLGLMGSGGSILTVPILVYALGIPPEQATRLSLFIVGTTALTGALPYLREGSFNRTQALRFGLPALSVLLATQSFLLPLLPPVYPIPLLGPVPLGRLLMGLFALLMSASAYSLIRPATATTPVSSPARPLRLYLVGAATGLISALLGAGGGFLIVPALVLLANTPIREAAGTSLLIISANTLIGFFAQLRGSGPTPWPLLLGFTACALAGLYPGIHLSRRLPGPALKKGFGYFLLLMAAYILLREFLPNH